MNLLWKTVAKMTGTIKFLKEEEGKLKKEVDHLEEQLKTLEVPNKGRQKIEKNSINGDSTSSEKDGKLTIPTIREKSIYRPRNYSKCRSNGLEER